MKQPHHLGLILLGVLLLPILMLGCESEDKRDNRYADLARESLRQQAQQNQALAAQTQQIAEASKHLVEADAEARRELGAMHEQLQTGLQSERQSIDRQRDELEGERREIAQQRHSDPIVAAAITHAALLIAAAAPLVFGIFLLRAVRNEDSDAVLGELLIGEFTAEHPMLIDAEWSRPPSLPAPPTAALRLQESTDPESATDDGIGDS